MTDEIQKEQFSIAYVRAVAAVAGVKSDRPETDDDSVDFRFSIKSIAGWPTSPIVEVQLKCTTETGFREDGIHFPLRRKNYDDLRGERLVPRYLIVVAVPARVSEWIRQSEEELALRKCGYWLSLINETPRDNAASVTIVIPRQQVFSPNALKAWFARGVQA